MYIYVYAKWLMLKGQKTQRRGKKLKLGVLLNVSWKIIVGVLGF